ncbi:MAG: four helix bundle protein [Gemmatimonadaceae bacterium]
MQDYTRLLVWQRARSLNVSMAEVARAFPPSLAPGLRAQLMRATMSIGATIAEGAGRESRPDFARFISMAAASASEAEHHLTVASDLGLIEPGISARLAARIIEVRRMLFGLRRALLAAEDDDSKRGPADELDS